MSVDYLTKIAIEIVQDVSALNLKVNNLTSNYSC